MQENHQRVVYYAARAGFYDAVKIGTTNNMARRLPRLRKRYGDNLIILGVEKDFGPENVFTLEGNRHHQFRKSNIVHEWFWTTPDLREHIASLNETDLEDVMP